MCLNTYLEEFCRITGYDTTGKHAYKIADEIENYISVIKSGDSYVAVPEFDKLVDKLLIELHSCNPPRAKKVVTPIADHVGCIF